ncbi:protein serine/threonine kinase activity [Sparganum proliferum]
MDSQNQHLSTFCGSPPYAAPELFSSTSYLGPPVDIWALGVLLFYLLVGFLPFRGRTVGQLRKSILECQQVKIPQRISESASSLLRELLCKNPLNRPKAAKLISDATHPSSSLPPASVSGVQPGVKSHTRDSECWLAGQVFPKAYPCFRISPNCDFQRPLDRCLLPTRTSDSASRSSLTILDTKSPSVDIEDVGKTANRLSVPSRDDIFEDGRGSDVSARSSLLPDVIVHHSESEAARLLLHMGISPEQMDVARCLEARSSITGAYRILLHRLHRLRRLSNLVVSGQGKSTTSEYENKSVGNIGAGNTTFSESLIETAGQQDTPLENEYNQIEWKQRRVCSLL